MSSVLLREIIIIIRVESLKNFEKRQRLASRLVNDVFLIMKLRVSIKNYFKLDEIVFSDHC